jgi:hypothetical protein
MFRLLLDRWHARQRNDDLSMLWPSIRDMAGDMNTAKAAFAVHAFNDKAWLCLGEKEIIRQIEELH